MAVSIDDINQGFMDRRPANYVPLSPISFLPRTAAIYGDRDAVIYGDRRYSWAETYERCVRLASALKRGGLQTGEVVTVMAANTPEMFEAQFGVAMAGGVLNTINTRLDSETVAYILDHGECRFLLTDAGFGHIVKTALAKASHTGITVIDIVDHQDAESADGPKLGSMDYETFLETGSAADDWSMPSDEWQAICLNYTSGTSGRPKGVVYHHRGAYLMAMGTVPAWGVPNHPVYLYTVPMFHCNGWGHAWMMALLAGTVVCTRAVAAEQIFDLLHTHRVTHFGGAPIVLGMMINAPEEVQKSPTWPIKVMTAGAPPPAAVLEKIEALGFEVMQVYGLTETYGHVVQCAWHEGWDELDFAARAAIKSRQGVAFPHTEEVSILDQASGEPVQADGKSIGEIVIRSNTVMKGYHKNPEATEQSLGNGAFRSGDLAVRHPNGYIEVKDRLKDIIISGGENISSVEIESVLYRYPGVAFAAIVAKPDEKWGETPCAFIEMQDGESASAEAIIAFCREHLAGFKIPKTVIFSELPKTSTGKIQKFELRKQVAG
jgi:3-(methylthio)propionyl---CoA ligase